MQHRLVGQADVAGVLASASEWTATVRHAEAAGRVDDAAGDLPPVGDEDLAEHARGAPWRGEGRGRHIRKTPKRVAGMAALSAGREREAEDAAGLGRLHDAVVPEPGGGVVGVALLLVLPPQRRLEGLLLLPAPGGAGRPRGRRAAPWPARWPPARRPSPRCGCWARSTGSAASSRGRTWRSCRPRRSRR